MDLNLEPGTIVTLPAGWKMQELPKHRYDWDNDLVDDIRPFTENEREFRVWDGVTGEEIPMVLVADEHSGVIVKLLTNAEGNAYVDEAFPDRPACVREQRSFYVGPRA